MEMTRRRLLGLAGAGLVTAAAGGLTRCGVGGAQPNLLAARPGGRAQGTVQVWTRSAVQAGMLAIVDRFHQAQSDVRVEVTPVLDVQYVTKLATAIRAGQPPDLVDIDDINSCQFVYRGVFTDLTSRVAELPYRDQLSPGHLHLATLGDRVYGVPFLADNSLLWLNTELFERAGVDPLQATRSLQTLREALPRLTRPSDGVYAWTFPGDGQGALGFTFLPHIWAAHADIFRGDIGSQTADVADNQALRSTLEFFAAMWRGRWAPPSCYQGALGFTFLPHIWAAHADIFRGDIGSQTADVADNQALRSTLEFFAAMWRGRWAPPSCYADQATTWGSNFLAGKIAIFPGNYAAVVKPAPASMLPKLKSVLIPGPEGGGCFFDGGDNLCMPRGAQNPDAAWEFVKFALEIAQQQSLPAAGYTPIRRDANTNAFARHNPLDTTPLNHLSAGYAPRTLAYEQAINEANGPFLEMFRRAVFQDDVEGALQAGQVGFTRLLEETQV